MIRLQGRPDGRLGLDPHRFRRARHAVDRRGSAPADIVCDAEQLRTVLAVADAGTRVDPASRSQVPWKGRCHRRPATSTSTTCPPGRWSNSPAVDQAGPVPRAARTGPRRGCSTRSSRASALDGRQPVTIILRSVFALTAMGFIRDADGREVTDTSELTRIADDEPVRVRASPAWIRIDARWVGLPAPHSGSGPSPLCDGCVSAGTSRDHASQAADLAGSRPSVSG